MCDRLIQNKLTVDIYGFSTDQFGISEMKNMVSRTGGICIIQEEFTQQVFQDSFRNIFALNEFGEMKIATGGRMQVFVSNPLKIKGAIGPCYSLKNKHATAA